MIRDILTVCRYDWLASYRSKLTIFWMLIYLLGSLASTSVFVFVLKKAETEVANQIKLRGTEKPGAMAASLQETETFQRLIGELLGDEELASSIMKQPLLGIFFGWLTLGLAPILVILLSSESISSDVSNGSVRYSLFRTSRIAWCIGKAVSITLLMFLCIVISAVGVWIIGYFYLAKFEGTTLIFSLLSFSWKGCIYSIPFLGLGLAVSQVIRSVQLSRALGIGVYFIISILYKIADNYAGEGISRLWDLVIVLLPKGHSLDFWRPDFMHLLNASLFCIGLGILYFFAGYAFFSRKDI